MENKKPFKDTEVGKLFTQIVPEGAHIIGDVLPDAGVLGMAKNILNKIPVSESVTQEQKDLVAQKLDELKLSLTDTEGARNMQVEALKQNDIYSKRFIYRLATYLLTFSFIYISGVTFFEVPAANKDIVNLITGTIIGYCLNGVVGFFFGSSHGSMQKDSTINNALNNQ